MTLQSAGVGVYRHHAKFSSNCMFSAVWCCQGLFPATARTLLLRPTVQSKSPFPFFCGVGEHGVRWCLLCLLGYRCAISVHIILNVIITNITARVRLFGVHDLIELVCDAECAAFILSSLHLINQISDD